jgi:hypothetical protein
VWMKYVDCDKHKKHTNYTTPIQNTYVLTPVHPSHIPTERIQCGSVTINRI